MQPANPANPWQNEAEAERARLLTALGAVTGGGIIGDIQHIGSTSVAGLPAHACIDLVLAVTPAPVETERLAALGYIISEPQANPYEQRALHTSGRFQLFISEQGSDESANHLLLRDYLRQNENARQRYAAVLVRGITEQGSDQESPVKDSRKDALFAELLAEANRWWPTYYAFRPVDFVVQELEGFASPWYISSGWALDLHLGRVTRVHHDVDVVVNRADQLSLREQLSSRGWRFVTPLDGKLEAWPPHMRLEMPRHQVHAHRDSQFIDCLLTDLSAETWRYRRNPLIIRHSRQAFMRSSQGIPYLAPELVLLYKSKNTGTRPRSKDQSDYEAVAPHLPPEARAWLRWALVASDPGHPWIEELADR